MKKRLALFDFDGTITTKDTFLEFIRFYHGDTKFITGFLLTSPLLILFKLKVIPNWKAKEKVLQWFFKDQSIADFNKKADEFCKHVVPKLIRPKALDEINNHIKQGTEVVVISASAENWVRPWCEKAGLKCLATKLEVADGKITGRLLGSNCYGPEKEKRILECFSLTEFDEVFAYGDSSGDREMLAMAHKPFYKPFRN